MQQKKHGRSLYWKNRWALYIQNKQGQHILLISLEIRLFFYSFFGESDMFDPLLLWKRLLLFCIEKKIGREKTLLYIGWYVMLQLRLINQLNSTHIPNKHCCYFFVQYLLQKQVNRYRSHKMDIDDKYCAISQFFHNLCEKKMMAWRDWSTVPRK